MWIIDYFFVENSLQFVHKLSAQQIAATNELVNRRDSALKANESFRTAAHPLAAALPKIAELPVLVSYDPQAEIKAAQDVVKTGKPKKPEELPWRVTPTTESGKLMSHYLMLSKFRLTCEFEDFFF
jgi:hypothetical protein